MNLITKLLSKLKPFNSNVSDTHRLDVNKLDVNEIKSITVGERDEKGFADVYVNGEKTNCRMLIFTPEQINKLEKIKADYTKSENLDKPNIEKLKKINEIYKKNNK